MTQKGVVIGGVLKFLKNGHEAINTGGVPTPPLPPYDVTVTIDKSAPVGTVKTQIGAGHIQHSLEYSGADPNGVARAMQLERDLAVDYNFTHMVGTTFALRTPLSPSAGAAGSTYNWTTSGSARGLDTSAGAVFPMFKTMNQGKSMLIAYSAETYQEPGRSANDPPTPAFFSDYANEVVNAIIRSEAVGGTAAIRAVGVWNEFKGYYSSGGRTQAKMEEHADLTAAIITAVKAHDSTIQIIAPHMNLGAYTDTGRTDPLKATSFSGYDRNNLTYWLNRCQVNGKLPDALSLDYSIVDFAGTAVGIGDLPYIIAGIPRFTSIINDANGLMQTAWGLKKPIWFIEQYFDVNLARSQWQGASPVYTQPFQACMAGGRYIEFVNADCEAAFWWQPDSRDGYCADGWWKMTGTGTDSSTGTPYSPYTALKTCRDALPLGANRYACSADQTYIRAAATFNKVALVNTSSSSKSVRVLSNPAGSAVVLTIPAYGVVSQVIT